MTAGLKTTCGSRMLEHFVAPYDAFVVQRLAEAGMVLIGKTNMDEFAMGSSNENSYFGPVRNPWDPTRVPGGSSGGSAAAVAARLVPAATGTDTGGSIRQPAALSGICGLKPTYGVCSRYGLIAFASSLDTPGVFAQTAQDCALLLNAMAGHDARDSTSLDRPAEDYTRDLARPLQGLRIGLPKEYFAGGTETGVIAAIEAALAELRKLGATTVEVSLPNIELAVPVYYVLAPAEASSQPVAFRRRALWPPRGRVHRPARHVQEDACAGLRRRGQAPHPDRHLCAVARLLRRVLPQGAAGAPPDRARTSCAPIETCDVIIGPTTPTTAFKLGDKTDDPVKMYLNDIYTIAANLAGAPAMSIPCGFDDRGLPVGMQILGNYFREAQLLNVAHQFQQATDWHQSAPTLAGTAGSLTRKRTM